MTHLPLTLGEHTTASGPVTITGFSRHGKWAFDAQSRCWSVETGLYGKYFHDAAWDITGRVEPAGFDVQMREVREIAIEAELARVTAERDEAVAASQALVVESARLAGCAEALRAIADLTEVNGMEFKRRHPALNSELDKRIQEHWYAVLSEFASSAFLAKIGGKPAEARNSQSDISTAHDALLALEMLKERQTGDSSGGSWSRGWDAGLDAAIKVVANLTEAKP